MTAESAPQVETENGIPVWKHGLEAIPVTNEIPRSLAEEDGLCGCVSVDQISF